MNNSIIKVDFMFSLECSSLDDKLEYSPQVKNGGKVILCQTLLAFYRSYEIKYPMMFKITTGDKIVHCGMIEFTAARGEMYLPQWMMNQLDIVNGQKAFVKYFQPVHGKSIQFQPHKTTFLDIEDHKSVLEVNLVNYACLSIGDTIPIWYEEQVYYGDIVDCKPAATISIVDCDLEVDFKAPKDYVEPVKTFAKTNTNARSTHFSENEDHCQTKSGPNVDYRFGYLSFVQDDFKPFVAKEDMKKDELKKFSAFQGKGYSMQ